MTKITLQEGKPVLRDGKVGTETACCCGCSRCIRNGEWDCQYTTQESCEDCTRTYNCDEARQTECDGDCPEGFTPGDPVTVQVEPSPACAGWNGYWASTAYAIATVGCGQILSVALDPDYPTPSGFARWGRTAPTVTATVTQSGGSASGAVLAVHLTQSTDNCGFPYWYISSISVVSPGSGYTIYEPEGNAVITLEDAPGDVEDGYGAFAYVSEVDENGGIVSVSVWDNSNRWHESAGVPAIITPHTVNIGGGGSGAVVTPVIDTDTSSPTFGHITGFTVTNGGSGYLSLCTRSGAVASCDECPPRTSPEYAFCSTFVADDGKPCGTWTPGFPCVEPPCCDSCLPECVPTLDAAEITTDYEKTSRISGPPWPVLYGPTLWNDEWVSQHASCTLIWVEDYVSQTNATGTYCGDWSYQKIAPELVGVYVPDPPCYLLGDNLWCPTYTRRFWFRMRLFLVDCRDRTLREVTDEALAAPVERTGCVVPSKYVCAGGGCANLPVCDVFANPGTYCLGANPGFLNAQPTLECPE